MPSSPTALTAHEGKPFLKTMFALANELGAIKRFSRLRMVHDENVLEHTGMVCVFAYIIGRKLQRCRDANRIDMSAVMCRAVVHDWDETITGDIVRPTKYFSGTLRGELSKLEAHGIDNIARALDEPMIDADFMRSKKGREGYVVKVADLLAALHRVWIEVCVLGNMNMRQPAGPMRSVIANLKNLAAAQGFAEQEIEVLQALLDQADVALDDIWGAPQPLAQLHEAR